MKICKLYAPMALMCSILLSCGGAVISGSPGEEKPKPEEPQVFDYNVFFAEKAAWEALRINNYRFTGRTFPDYPQPAFTVTVSADKKTIVNYAPDAGDACNPQTANKARGLIEDGRPFSPLQGSAINELYASIEAEIANLKGWTARIRYNQTYHYPELFIKSVAPVNGEFLDGGWYEFKITHFEVIDGE